MIIKHAPEDFIVEELPAKEWDDAGTFAVFKLVKKGLNTEQSVEIISRRLHVPIENIKYAGAKDKHAYTTQYISIPNRTGISDLHLDEDNLKLQHVGFNDEPLSLGALKGNRFIITVREITSDEKKLLEHNKNVYLRHPDAVLAPNYFDEQRFSSNNYNIGLSILKKDYKSAVKYMCESSDIYADTIRIYLTANPNDYVTALKRIPKRTSLMFIHAVQSYIFNEALTRKLSEFASEKNLLHKIVPYSLGNFIYYDDASQYAECLFSIEKLPLVGFSTINPDHHIKKILESAGLSPRDFIVRPMPDLSVEGTERDCFVDVKNLEIEILNDRAIIEFELPKGSYATNVIKMLFS